MPDKGPRVFLDYDQAALDAAYDQAVYAANREQLIKRRIRDSELARHRIGEPERVAYGSAEIERLDIYRGRRKLAPVFRHLAQRALEGFRQSSRDVPCRRGALCRSRLRLGTECRRQPDGSCRPGLPRRRLVVQECRSFRRRPQSALYRWPIVWWASRRGRDATDLVRPQR